MNIFYWNHLNFLILSYYDAILDTVQLFDEGGGLDSKFWKRSEKKLLKMDQFIVSSKTISYLSSKHMFDADAALDDKPDKILFVFCLKQI